MNGKKKILVLGIGQSNFLNQLYGDVLLKDNQFSVDVDKFYDVSKGQVANDSPFQTKFNFDDVPVSTLQKIAHFFAFSLKSFFWEILFFELSQKMHPKLIFQVLQNYARANYIVKKRMLPQKHHLYHFHYCTPEHLRYIHFLPKNTNIICSFWGSDLMRITGVSNVYYVSKALRKATKITIQSEELAQILLFKYGREFESKIVINQFTINTDIYHHIDRLLPNTEAINAFKTKHSIPTDKIIIAVSHNAFSANNHFKILDSLASLEPKYKDQCSFILPLGYGGNEQYINEIKTYCDQHSELQTQILTDFFDPENTALLRLSTDLMIQMPISDALSGAMTEVLYTGNTVISASWLPYGVLKNNQLPLIEAFNFEQLPRLVADFCAHRQEVKKTNQNNATKIKSFLFPDTTSKQWISLFNSMN
jgi:glycosyltransferase involved in cell wall biosynthesis